MVNKKLLDWIKSEEAQGHSEKALARVLMKKNYSNKEIQKAFNSLKEKGKKIPPSVSFILIVGLSIISLILTTIVVLITTTFQVGVILGHFLIILCGIGIGYYIYYIKQKLNATEIFGAVLAVLSPILSFTLIVFVLNVLQKLAKQLSAFSMQEESVGGWANMTNIFNTNLDPYFSGILFYLGCNIFIIISIIKSKEYKTFLIYLLAPVILVALIIIINIILTTIMDPAF